MRRGWVVTLLLVASAASADDASCIQCHGDRGRLQKLVKADAARVAANFVDTAKMARTVHGGQGCGDCHHDYRGYPHRNDGRSTAACADCHEAEAAVLAKSVHGGALQGDRPVSCADCHGKHDVFKATERESRVHPLNVTRTCGACHFEGIDAATAPVEALLKQRLMDDMHGQGLLTSGLTVSATCVSCHGTHDTRPKGDTASRVGRKNVAEVCGSCHTGVLEQYRLSIHNVARENGNDDAATCTDCHAPHTAAATGSDIHEESVKRCGECHEQKMDSFRSTRHGKITSLGYGGRVADCASCHGAHDTRASNDIHSRIHPDKLVATCAECHPGSHESFVGYQVHAVWDGGEESDPLLRAIYLAIDALLIGSMIFALVHSVLWLVRATFAGDWKKVRGGRTLRRWPSFYVKLHVIFMCSFLLLAATGLPLYYSEAPWARRLMIRFGGAEAAGWVHRVSALTMLGCIAAYVIHIGRRFFVLREKGLWTGPNTMLPRWQDAKDFLGIARWFFFLGKRPRIDRWAYWEKFDFWAVFWGIVMIGGTGLVLWFPVEATHIMPGWMVNVAAIVHGHEALLAVGFIFTFHVFNANLRPDKFPIDPLFFTGRHSEEEMKHERGVEYDRAVAEGKLDDLVDEPPERGALVMAYVLGGVVMIAGIVLVILAWSVS